MNNLNTECDHCGGTQFYKEAGFYYCSGCQVQSQDVQELVFEEYAPEQPKGTTKKIHKDKAEKIDNKITSWECYNYVLLGLTNELICLGAHKDLKAIVRILWLRYLEKLQVFKKGADNLPKLQAVNCSMDAEIVYGRLPKEKRKRTKSSSSELDTATLDSSSLRRERAKRKRALVQAQYDDFAQQSQGTPASLHNETLTSLQTGSEKSSKKAPITYNTYAARELRKRQSREHLRKHRFDFERNLNCHKLTYRNVSYKYRVSPFILSLNKLYAILYLGLLIVKDKIQLSDILRFIKEGHLSFNCYSHLFPEDFADKSLNFRNFKKNSEFAKVPLRVITSQMAEFLQVDWYIVCPDLIELCERYCRELNLPNEVCDCAKNIISRTEVKMSFRKRASKVPNYEGRVLSIILFVVKLLFGLDGMTEFHLANYSEIINQSEAVRPKMFNVVSWLKYIEYRNAVLTYHHFPTSYTNDHNIKTVDSGLSVIYRKEYPEGKSHSKKDNYRQVLTKLKDQLPEFESTEFPMTLTPFLDYIKILPKDNFLSILSDDYTHDSLDHILKPCKFLNIVNNGEAPEIVHQGANDDWIVEAISCPEQENKLKLKEKRKFVTVKLTLDPVNKTGAAPEKNQIDNSAFKENFRVANESLFRKNSKRLERLNDVMDIDLERIRQDLSLQPGNYPKHYNPYERFWMRTLLRIEALNQKECVEFLDKFPHTFRLVFGECQRIAQQTEQELLLEYQLTELYLAYLADYKVKHKDRECRGNRLLVTFLEKRLNLW